MYFSGQIIYDLDKKQPVQLANAWDSTGYPARSVHFVDTETIGVVTPRTVADAKKLLAEGKIRPAKDSGHDCPVRGRVWWAFKHCEWCNSGADQDDLINSPDNTYE